MTGPQYVLFHGNGEIIQRISVILCYILAVVLPFLLCGVNTAIIVTRIKAGVDIRSLGSGNPGLTNTLRTQGKIAALFVLIGDVLKGVLSVVLVKMAFKYFLGLDISVLEYGMTYVGYIAGFFASVGHIFPLYYKFKGGKGVLVTVSALYTIDWVSASILFGIFIIIVIVTRYVSLGSVIAGSLYPFCVLTLCLFRGDPAAYVNFILGIMIAGLLVLMHRENIKRLINRTEKKLGERTKEKL